MNLATKEIKTLTTDGYDARLTSNGYLVFGRSGRVFAAKFDPERQAVGEPVPVASGVRMHALYPHLQLAVSATGVLVYAPGGDVGVAAPAWVSRQGQTEFLPIEPRVYGMFDLSDDGRRLAIQVGENKDYILIYDIERNSSRRLPAADSAGWPKWSPSGDALAYTSFAEGKPYRILVQRMDSDRPPVVVAESPTRLTPSTWSPDGQRLTFYEFPANRMARCLRAARRRDVAAAGVHEFQRQSRTTSRWTDAGWPTPTAASMFGQCRPASGFRRSAIPAPSQSGAGSAASSMYRNGNRWFSAEVRLGPVFEWKPPRLIVQTSTSTTALDRHSRCLPTASGSSSRSVNRNCPRTDFA